ncbi:MAG: recombinase family protein [Rickettsiales bacterium]|nr:recombinase family protein [Rickettsiales bacterium]
MSKEENRTETKPHRHLIGYVRVSKDDQDLALQKEALVKYGVNPLDIYEDKATGRNMNRKGWQALLKDARPGDAIVVWKIDRLSRNVMEGIQTATDLAKRDVSIISLDGLAANMDTPMGKVMFYMGLIFAELEVMLVSDRTKAGLATARGNKRLGGRPMEISHGDVLEAYRYVYRDEGVMKDILKTHNRRYKTKKTAQGYYARFNKLSEADRALALSDEALPDFELPKRRRAKKEQPDD